MKLSNNQIKIIKAPEDRVVVISSAASGKTECLTQRVKYLISRHAVPEKMVVITFTNAAAEEMRERLGYDATDIFIGTIHAYANHLLMSNNIDTFGLIQKEDFDGLFNLIKENPSSIKPVDYLLLDEAQDLNEKQFEFIFNMIKPIGFFVVGDYRQSLYEFNGGRPDLFCGLTGLEDVKTYDLNENYRNGKKILDYAGWILSTVANKYSSDIFYQDNSICCSGRQGYYEKIDYDADNFATLINKYGNYGDWFILTRNNKQLAQVYRELSNRGIPCDSFKQADLERTQLQDKMKSNTVKVLTIHASKGLEANNVIVIGMFMNGEEESRIGYVAATRAKERLYWVSAKRKKTQKISNWE